jgi:hypothetical protein
MAEVVRPRGVAFKSVGREIRGRLFLLGEEALYLMEAGSLIIHAGGSNENYLPWSLEQAYAAITQDPFVTLDTYAARELDKT